MPAISPPKQDEVDAVASFVEACAELDREPFFGQDEKRVLAQQGDRITCILGDRFYFRSALISFRRIWMPSEPSHVHNVADALRHSNLSPLLGGFLDYHQTAIKGKESGVRRLGNREVTGERIVNLWLNTVFAHGGISGKNKRSEFEALVDEAGHALFEYAFRMLVWELGLEYRNIAKLVARPVLADWKQDHNISPSFRIGSAFGIKRREVTKEGHVIIRQGSSEYFTEETFEERFARILDRHMHQELKFLLRHLDVEDRAQILAVLKCSSTADLLRACDAELRLVEKMPEPPPITKTFRGSTGITSRNSPQWSRANIFEGPIVETDIVGLCYLDEALRLFKKQLVEE